MRHLSAVITVVGLAGNLDAAPPAQNGDAGPHEILSPTDVKNLRDRTPLTMQGIEKMFGLPAGARRSPAERELTFWEYRVPTGRVLLVFKNGRLVRAYFPAPGD
jgi:hypothetical protein